MAFGPGNRGYVTYVSATNGVAELNATTAALVGRVETPDLGVGDIAIDPRTGHALLVGPNSATERQIGVVNGSTLLLEMPIPHPIPHGQDGGQRTAESRRALRTRQPRRSGWTLAAAPRRLGGSAAAPSI
jgi:hypothetical protein